MTVFLIIQIIMMLVGAGEAGFDSDVDVGEASGGGDDVFNTEGFGSIFGLRILTIRSMVAFLSIGSWTTFTLCYLIPVWAAVLIGIVAGAAAAFGVAALLKSLEKLENSGNIIIDNTVGLLGEVYLTVPAARSGNGKVNVIVQERLTEFAAVTDSQDPIKTGEEVKVLSIVGGGTLLVGKA
jgi:hypothetical protein